LEQVATEEFEASMHSVGDFLRPFPGMSSRFETFAARF